MSEESEIAAECSREAESLDRALSKPLDPQETAVLESELADIEKNEKKKRRTRSSKKKAKSEDSKKKTVKRRSNLIL